MRAAIAFGAVTFLLLTGCSHRTTQSWGTQALCESAKPGKRCAFRQCDYKCPDGYFAGYVPVGPLLPSPPIPLLSPGRAAS